MLYYILLLLLLLSLSLLLCYIVLCLPQETRDGTLSVTVYGAFLPRMRRDPNNIPMYSYYACLIMVIFITILYDIDNVDDNTTTTTTTTNDNNNDDTSNTHITKQINTL